jgi:hypothetical protein
MRGLWCLTGLLCACLALGLPATAAAAVPGWLPPAFLSALSGDATDPRVAFDAHGNATAVWSHHDGAARLSVQAAMLPAGSDLWQMPADLSAPGGDAVLPRIAVDAQGNAIAVWSRYDLISSGIVQAAWRPAATGIWQPPVDLSPAGQMTYQPSVGFDGHGNAIVAWLAYPGLIRAAVRPAASGLWQAPVDVSSVGAFLTDPQLAVDPQGDAIVVWWGSSGVQAAVRPAATGVWQAPTTLSPAGQNAVTPQVAFDV